MRGMGRIAALVAACALLAACGLTRTEPPDTGVEPPPPATGENAVTISPFDDQGDGTEDADEPSQAVFPAEDPQGLLDLAAQHPDGKVVYEMALDGRAGELTVISSGEAGVVAVSRDDRTVRVGIDLVEAAILWVCVTEGAEEARCRDEDRDDEGASALATAALLVGEDRVRQIATRVTAAPDANLEVEARAGGIDASCLTGTSPGIGDLRVCVSPSGFITDTEEGSTRATAYEVTEEVDPLELQPTRAPA